MPAPWGVHAGSRSARSMQAGDIVLHAVYRGELLTRDFVEAAHAVGLGVNVWTLRPASLGEAFEEITPLIDIGVDGIITDNPDLARAVVDSYEVAPIPLPASLPMLGAAALLLGGFHRLGRRAG